MIPSEPGSTIAGYVTLRDVPGSHDGPIHERRGAVGEIQRTRGRAGGVPRPSRAMAGVDHV